MKASPRLAELIASLSLAIDLELASGINRVRTFEPAAAREPYETSGRASYDAGWRLRRLATRSRSRAAPRRPSLAAKRSFHVPKATAPQGWV